MADFDWPSFDRHEDLGAVKVPYVLSRVNEDTPSGTTLVIGKLRTQVSGLELKRVRTESIGVLSPLRSLFRTVQGTDAQAVEAGESDPGFLLLIQGGAEAQEQDVAASILDAYVLRASVRLDGTSLEMNVYRRDDQDPYLSIIDSYKNDVRNLRADIRFFPRRKGVFANTGVDGRRHTPGYMRITA